MLHETVSSCVTMNLSVVEDACRCRDDRELFGVCLGVDAAGRLGRRNGELESHGADVEWLWEQPREKLLQDERRACGT